MHVMVKFDDDVDEQGKVHTKRRVPYRFVAKLS